MDKRVERHRSEKLARRRARPRRAESVVHDAPFMKSLTLARLPIFACAGFIGFLFLANLWNFAVERDWPKLRIRSA